MQKVLYILLVTILTTILPCRAQEHSPLVFNETDWNFGTIHEEGGLVTHIFKFTNNGLTPIAIDRVNTSCGCTTPEYTRGVVQPGDEAQVNVSFNPMGFPLVFTKSIDVVSGGGKFSDRLSIRGHVTPRVKSLEELYPHDMGGGVRFDNIVLPFRQIAQGGNSSMVVGWTNTSDRDVAIVFNAVETSGLFALNAPETLCAGCKGNITATYDLAEKSDSYGVMTDVFKIAVDGADSPKTLYATMTGIDDFSDVNLETAPRLFLDTQFHNFGELRLRQVPYSLRIILSNEGKETLHIRSVTEKHGCKSTLRGGMTIAPGDSLPFEIIFYSDRYRTGDVRESLIMIVDDPLRPVREIRIAAKLK
jgi:hypothetical protein